VDIVSTTENANPKALAGRGLMQSPAEWDARNRALADALAELVRTHAPPAGRTGIDVGCQTGVLTDELTRLTDLEWTGIDPRFTEEQRSPAGAALHPGFADSMPFPDGSFDCAVFANVYEHVDPEKRSASLAEIRRVLAPGGVVVGQLPNPYFPIESHSRLPFMGFLPRRLQLVYWKLSPVPWQHDFYSVTIRDLAKRARALGLEPVVVRNFNYPPEVIPQRVRWAARMLERPMRHMPWAWQFVLRRP
jgi:SAM-dependent methyltransferase